jgi:hypothetical protein
MAKQIFSVDFVIEGRTHHPSESDVKNILEDALLPDDEPGWGFIGVQNVTAGEIESGMIIPIDARDLKPGMVVVRGIAYHPNESFAELRPHPAQVFKDEVVVESINLNSDWNPANYVFTVEGSKTPWLIARDCRPVVNFTKTFANIG